MIHAPFEYRLIEVARMEAKAMYFVRALHEVKHHSVLAENGKKRVYLSRYSVTEVQPDASPDLCFMVVLNVLEISQ